MDKHTTATRGTRDLAVAVLLVAVFLFSGCSATTHVAGDDATVARAVTAEKSLFNSTDALLTLEQKNRDYFKPLLPNLKPYIDVEKEESETVLTVLRTFTKLYREAPKGQKPGFDPIIVRAEELSKEIQSWLTRMALAVPQKVK